MEEVRHRSRHVLKEDGSGLAFGDDPPDIGPEVPGVLSPTSFPSDAERLAREARNDEIHDSTPRHAIERSKVGPDGGRIQPSVPHTGHQDGLAERVDLDVGDRPGVRDGPPDAKVKSSDT
jgi:hypothetical protein